MLNANKHSTGQAINMEKSQHTDFNKDKTNESASVACSHVWL